MKNLLGKTGSLVVGGLCVAGALPLSAATLYDNLTGTPLQHVEPGTDQIGDQVVLTGGSLFDLSRFSFQYWGTFSSTVQVQVGFYQNDGALFNGYASPGTSLWQSDWFTIPSDSDGALVQYDAGTDFNNLTLPSTFTWTVQFKGMGAGDHVGVDTFDRLDGAAGMDYPDYWRNNGGTWELLKANDGTPVNFGARFEGVVVPEPSSMALLALGGLGLVALRRSRRQA